MLEGHRYHRLIGPDGGGAQYIERWLTRDRRIHVQLEPRQPRFGALRIVVKRECGLAETDAGAVSALRRECSAFGTSEAVGQHLGAGRRSLASILTRSARESAFIFRITLPRCALTVISLMPSSPPICLFSRPETTSIMTSRSRRLSDA